MNIEYAKELFTKSVIESCNKLIEQIDIEMHKAISNGDISYLYSNTTLNDIKKSIIKEFYTGQGFRVQLLNNSIIIIDGWVPTKEDANEYCGS